MDWFGMEERKWWFGGDNWVREARMKYRQLSLEERCTLTALRREGFGIVAISERLGRHRSTLWRELGRNRSRHDGATGCIRRRNASARGGADRGVTSALGRRKS